MKQSEIEKSHNFIYDSKDSSTCAEINSESSRNDNKMNFQINSFIQTSFLKTLQHMQVFQFLQ